MELPRRRLVVVAGLALAVITALSGPVAAGEVGAKVGTSPVPRVSAPVFGESGPNALPPPKNLDYLLRVAPIPGLTTIWHVMPHVTDVPVGTVVRLHLAIPPGVDVTWTGAFELGRDAWGVDALCPLIEVGDALIEASYHHPFFGPTTWTCDITVINIQPSDIDVGVTLSAESMEIDESLPENELNDLTMAYYFNERSYAALRDLGGGQYRTSTSRMVTLNADVDPPGIAPLIEWRLNGVAKARGTAWYQLTDEVGIDAIDVGPTAAPASVQLETYRVSITPAQDVVIDGEPSVYFAQTTPPGYESDVTWLSSTKYGSATPIISEGPMLTVLFENTWSPGNTEQWLGVKADNEVTGQDGTKCCLPFSEADLLAFWEDPIANPLPDVCIDLPCADCMLLGGTCFTGDCPLVTQTVTVHGSTDHKM
ncbi:MAG: hypothetical protein GY715_19760 [Planctomycetes bacterium]|nr:hypothetical protein [Planctomycetota bacterium]